MLNSTRIIRYIEKHLGYKFMDLELSPDDIIEDIREYTLKTYSKYFPYIVPADVIDSERVEVDKCNKLYIDSKGLNILSINRLITGNYEYVDPSIILRTPIPRDIFAATTNMDMNSMIQNPVTFRFYPPNTIEIYPSVMASTNSVVYLNCVHPKHFGTIPDNMEEQFLKLALLDVKSSLYEIRHRFANLETPYGNIELFIDDLQEAESKKEELLEVWRKLSHKQSNRKRLYIY